MDFNTEPLTTQDSIYPGKKMKEMDFDRETLLTQDSIKPGDNDTIQQGPSGYVATAPPLQVQSFILVGPESTLTTCPFCFTLVKTAIKYTSTNRTHLTALRFCILIPFCGCCLPHCMESTRNVDHYCPNCTRYLGTYEK